MKRTDKEGKQMLLIVKSLLDDNSGFSTARSAFTDIDTRLTTNLEEIVDLQTAQGIATHGDVTNKENKHYDLATTTFKIASATSAYASKPSVNDPVLKGKVNFSLDEISAFTYATTESKINNILAAITPAIIANLAPYGIVTQDKTNATEALTAFLLIQNEPQSEISARTVTTASIHPKVVEGKKLLEDEGDQIANTLFSDHHDLYLLWYAARRIIHFPAGTTIATGFVYKEDGITPIYNAEVNFNGTIVRTFLDGSYTFAHIPRGIYSPIASAVGFESQTIPPYEIKQGHTVRKNFALRAI